MVRSDAGSHGNFFRRLQVHLLGHQAQLGYRFHDLMIELLFHPVKNEFDAFQMEMGRQ
jgi:hypothetical protein